MKEKQCSSPLHEWCEPINDSSYLYRTQYLVVSRTMLEAMPKDWQHRWVKLMDEVHEEFDVNHPDWVASHYNVQAKGEDGRIIKDPWGNYRHPDHKWIERFRNKKK